MDTGRNFWLLFMVAVLFLLPGAAMAQIQVSAASPNSTIQGTVNLNVTVSGKGFKNGAKAKWFVSGTTDPGGVTVNSTAFVNSTTLVANITVSDTAVVSGYDIQVTNSDGRIGSGTELFAVQAKTNSNTCTAQPLPSNISLVATLNNVTGSGSALYSSGLGHAMRSARMTLGSQSVVLLAVANASASPARLEIFFLDPATGQVLDGTNIGSTTAVQPHISVSYNSGSAGTMAVGDVNGDGIPDFGTTDGPPTVFVGSVTNGILSYQPVTLTPPAGASGVTWGIAMGDLNGDGQDEVAVGWIGNGSLGEVGLFSWNGSGFANYQTIVSPLPNKKKDERFGQGVAIRDVTGDSHLDLIVSASNSTVNGAAAAGRIFVFPGPVSGSNYLTFTTGIQNDNFGYRVADGNVNGGPGDFLASTNWTGTDIKADVYTGLVSNPQAPSYTLRPQNGLAGAWGTMEPRISDVNGDGLDDVIVGAPNTSSSGGCGGSAYLFLSDPLTSTPVAAQLLIQQGATSTNFGWATALAPGSRIFFVSDNSATVGSTTNAGQVYVYMVN